jgi:hypothetical protein
VDLLFSSRLYFLRSHYRAIQLMPFAFLFGIIAGGWRIRFKSLVPLALAHTVVNSIAWGPWCVVQYDRSLRLWPKYHEVDLIADQPEDEAIQRLVEIMSDDDDTISNHAIEVLAAKFPNETEPYLQKALGSDNSRIVDRALFAVEWFAICGHKLLTLALQIRSIAWSSADFRIQLDAILALQDLNDLKGLSDIAERHPNEKARGTAARCLRYIKERN